MAWSIALTVVSLALLGTIWPLISGRAEPVWDAANFHFPSYVYQADALREGRLPLWDPYTSCGYPFFADPNNATLNPVAALIGLAAGGTLAGFVSYWVFFWWLAAVGMLGWARARGATPEGAVVASLSYALSGFFVGHAEHTVFVLVGAALPFAFWMAETAVSRKSLGHAFLCGASFALTFQGGYPPMMFFAVFMLTLWLGLEWVSGAGDSFRSVAVTSFTAAVVLAVAASPTLYAFFSEGRGYTDRVEPLGYEAANFDNVFSVRSLFSLLYPHATIVARDWLGTDVSMANGYAGALAVPLAGVWVWKQRGARQSRTWWYLVFIAIAFLTAMGGRAGVRIAFYYLLPPMRFMRHSAALRVFWILPLALGAGLGFSALQTSANARQIGWRLALGWAAVAAATALWLSPFLHHVGRNAPWTDTYGVTAAVLCASAITLLALPRSGERTRKILLVLLCGAIATEMCVATRLNAVTLWTMPPRVTPRYAAQHYRSTEVSGAPEPRLPATRWFNWPQITKQAVTQGYVGMRTRVFDTLVEGRFGKILQLPMRTWLVPGGEVAPSRQEALQMLARTGPREEVPAFMDPPLARRAERRVKPGEYGSVSITTYAPEHVRMRVDVPDTAPALLVSTERYAPSWKASIDGIATPVLRVNLVFRAVWVPPGAHTVSFEYEPIGFLALAPLSIIALLGSLLAGVLLIRAKKAG